MSVRALLFGGFGGEQSRACVHACMRVFVCACAGTCADLALASRLFLCVSARVEARARSAHASARARPHTHTHTHTLSPRVIPRSRLHTHAHACVRQSQATMTATLFWTRACACACACAWCVWCHPVGTLGTILSARALPGNDDSWRRLTQVYVLMFTTSGGGDGIYTLRSHAAGVWVWVLCARLSRVCTHASTCLCVRAGG